MRNVRSSGTRPRPGKSGRGSGDVPSHIAAIAFRFNPVTKWDFGDEDYPAYDFWPAKRFALADELPPGLPVLAWQSGSPRKRGIRAVGVVVGRPEGPLGHADLLRNLREMPRRWRSRKEYIDTWLGALRLPIKWWWIFDEPIEADQAPVCRPVAQARNPFPLSTKEWAGWKRAIVQGVAGSIDLP